MTIMRRLGFLECGGHKALQWFSNSTLKAASDNLEELGLVINKVSRITRGNMDGNYSLRIERLRTFLQCASVFIYASRKVEPSGFAIPLEGYGNLPAVINKLGDKKTPFPNCMAVLLHGEPGTGKSHFMSCVGCRHIRLDEAWFDNRTKMSEALSDNWGLLIDEVDDVYERRPSELHSLLDDVHNGKHGDMVVVLTTNHFDKIKDTPLVRPGRVDRILEIGPPTEKDLERYFSLLPELVTREEVEARVSKPYTMAKLGQAVKDIYMENLIKGI